MENIILFFCDIYGTINGNVPNTEKDYKEFNCLLNELSKQNNNTKILFTLISSEKKEIVMKYLLEIKQYINGNIIFSKQFYENGYILDNKYEETICGKFKQMLDDINELKKTANIIRIYYADDSVFLQTIISEYFKCEEFTIPFISLIPEETLGLKEINRLLNIELDKNKVK